MNEVRRYWVHEDRMVDERASMDVSSLPGSVCVVRVADYDALAARQQLAETQGTVDHVRDECRQIKDFLRILSDPTQRFTHEQKGMAWDQVIASHRALAARVERSETALRGAGWTYLEGAESWKPPLGPSASPLLQTIDNLTEQLAEAQGTVARLREATQNLTCEVCKLDMHRALKGA